MINPPDGQYRVYRFYEADQIGILGRFKDALDTGGCAAAKNISTLLEETPGFFPGLNFKRLKITMIVRR